MCTNLGVMVTAAIIHLALLGPKGLERIAISCYDNTYRLVEELLRIEGVECPFDGDPFHERVLRLKASDTTVNNPERARHLGWLVLGPREFRARQLRIGVCNRDQVGASSHDVRRALLQVLQVRGAA